MVSRSRTERLRPVVLPHLPVRLVGVFHPAPDAAELGRLARVVAYPGVGHGGGKRVVFVGDAGLLLARFRRPFGLFRGPLRAVSAPRDYELARGGPARRGRRRMFRCGPAPASASLMRSLIRGGLTAGMTMSMPIPFTLRMTSTEWNPRSVAGERTRTPRPRSSRSPVSAASSTRRTAAPGVRRCPARSVPWPGGRTFWRPSRTLSMRRASRGPSRTAGR